MKKFLIIALLVIAALVAVYVIFLIDVIKIGIGAIFLGVALVAGLIAWIMWKIKKE